ncbi:MAG: hypothetical protein L0H64_21140 [Pseudonocardia sp.]|nr:hypothetical protein [Pseudonocardia sp.]
MESVDPDPAERRVLVEAVLAAQAAWLYGRCQKAVATRPGIDAADVFQDAVKRLLLTRTEVDPARDGVRTFLGRCVDWAVHDLAAERERQGGVAISEEEFDSALESAAADEPDTPDDGPLADRELLVHIGLSANQIDTVLRDAQHPDLSWKEFALLVGRPYGAVRQDRKRALDKIETWLGLDAEERRAYAAHRRTGSVSHAADALHLPEPKCRALLQSAHLKIRLRLHPREEGRS